MECVRGSLFFFNFNKRLNFDLSQIKVKGLIIWNQKKLKKQKVENMAEQQQQLIDCFENPFLGMEGKIMKKLGETEDGHQRVEAGAGCEQDGE